MASAPDIKVTASPQELDATVSKDRRITQDMYDTIVRITVGPESAIFHLHKGLICNTSAYFKAAFEGQFKEASEQLVHLPEECPRMFRRFVLWVYSGSIIESPKEACTAIEWRDLFGLYVFGDARSIPALQNAVIDTLIDKSHQSNRTPTCHFIYIYDNTRENSPLRRLVADWIVYRVDDVTAWSGFNTEERPHYPRECLFDIIAAQSRVSKNPALKTKDFTKIRANYYVQISTDLKDSPVGGIKRKIDEVK